MHHIGFTGTSKGLTNDQLLQVHMLVGDLKTAGASHAHHGMCLGGDAAFHDQVKGFGYTVIGHPGITGSGKPWKRADCVCDVTKNVQVFLTRNRAIVAAAEVMIACPAEFQPRIKSGTWATIRYTRQAKKPLIILYPDGSSSVEQVPGMPLTAEEYRVQLIARTGE